MQINMDHISAPQWRIALTESQQERTAAAHLLGRQFQVYFPTFEKVTQHWRGGVRRTERPMFPGYLFVRFALDMPHWERLFHTPGVRPVHSLLVVDGHYAVLPESTIAEVAATENRLRAKVHKTDKVALPYQVGDTVQMRYPEGGAFSGFFAKIEELDDIERIVLLMSIFGRESRVVASHHQLAVLPSGG